jgi:hypothetical protein
LNPPGGHRGQRKEEERRLTSPVHVLSINSLLVFGDCTKSRALMVVVDWLLFGAVKPTEAHDPQDVLIVTNISRVEIYCL